MGKKGQKGARTLRFGSLISQRRSRMKHRKRASGQQHFARTRREKHACVARSRRKAEACEDRASIVYSIAQSHSR